MSKDETPAEEAGQHQQTENRDPLTDSQHQEQQGPPPPSYNQATPVPDSSLPEPVGPAEVVSPLPHHPQLPSEYGSPPPQWISTATESDTRSSGYPHSEYQYGSPHPQQAKDERYYANGMPMQPGQYQYNQQYQQNADGSYSMGQYYHDQQQPQAQPPITSPGGGQYQSVTPLYALGSSPSPIQCPSCGQRAMTKVELKTGNTTHAWAAGLCIFTCCFCISYLIPQTKDVEHTCSNCKARVATWHRSGRTEVHVHS